MFTNKSFCRKNSSLSSLPTQQVTEHRSIGR
jgi:hypothetical protein